MMRYAKLLAVAVLAILIVSAAMPASAHINLLQNPGFETGQEDPWDIEEKGGLTDISHTGDWAAEVDVHDQSGWVAQLIDPPRCAEYLEFWYQGEVVEGSWEFRIYYSDGTEYMKVLSKEDDWALQHADLDTTKLVEEVQVTMRGSHGRFSVDDFDLEACPAPAVGGVVMPAGMFAILAPWLAVIGLVGCIGTVVVVARKRRS